MNKKINIFFKGYLLGMIVLPILATLLLSNILENPYEISELSTFITNALVILYIVKTENIHKSRREINNDWIVDLALYFVIFLSLSLFGGMISSELATNLKIGTTTSVNQDLLVEGISKLPLMSFINIVLLAPILEELIFREGLYNAFNNKRVGLFVSSVLFALAHFTMTIITIFLTGNGYLDIIVFFPTYFFKALGLAYAYYKTHDLRICIGVHMLNNLLGFVVAML